MVKFIKEIRESKPWEICLMVVGIAAIALLLINAPALELHSATRMVRHEMNRMGHPQAADVVTLEATSRIGIYRASVSVHDEDGRMIEYWKRADSFGVLRHSTIAPFHEYEETQD